MTIDNTVLVLGGTGKTGRRVVERFTKRDVPVRWFPFWHATVRLGEQLHLGIGAARWEQST